jgi:predicted Zn-dependent peptidase
VATPAARQAPGTTRTLLSASDGRGPVRRTVLPGGLRVVTEAMPAVRSAAVGVWIAVGSRDEAPALSGASHFLEHLLFKGTDSRSALDISVALDEVGGEFNAFTAKEYTCFHARVLDEDLPLAVDVLGDMVTSSTISREDVEAEREVILDEIAMHDDDPDDVVSNVYAAKAWGGSPLGRPVAGTVETIETLTREQIRRYYRARYTADKVVVAAAGNLDHASVVRRVRRAFSRRGFLDEAGRVPAPARRTSRPRRTSPGDVVVERPFEQANVLLGVNGPARTDERRFALGVLDAVLGGGTSSRLFQEVREHRGLAYSVFSYASHYADAGTLAVAVGCLPSKVGEVLDVVRAELARLADQGVSAEELRRGQGQLRGGLVLSLEDPGSRMSRLAKADLLYGELLSIDEVLRRVSSVSLDEVNDLARALLRGPQTLAVVGPFDTLPR